MQRSIVLLAAVAAGGAVAGRYDQPYALVERGASSETRKEVAVGITQIDGVSTANPRRSDPLPPGNHRITLHVESARGSFRPEYLDVELDLKACTRYAIVARYESRHGPDWVPKVYAETIGECARKFRTVTKGR